MHTYTAGNSIFDGPITSLPSVSCILKEIISRAHAKGGRSVSGFKFGTFVCRFPSDGAASMAVKELILCGEIRLALLWYGEQQPQEQRYPFLPVCAVFLCVQTMVWLPTFEVFTVCTEVDACGKSRERHSKRVVGTESWVSKNILPH